jgi:hypothetical protein
MSISIFVRPLAAATVVLCAAAVSLGAGADEYVKADAVFSAQEIHAFTDEGRNVTVALGDFRLKVGPRQLTGRDAVLWVSSQPVAGTERHEITAYVEGDATLTEADGSKVSRIALMATFRSEGRFVAQGIFSDRPLEDFPLYQRAKQALAAGHPVEEAPPPTTAAPGPSDPQPVETPAPVETPQPIGHPATPAGEGAPQPLETLEPRPAQPPVATAGANAPEPVEAKPVSFHAGQVVQAIQRWNERTGEWVTVTASRPLEKGEKTRWVTIAGEGVYLSQGNPDSDLFMEMRADRAVIFTREGVKDVRDTNSPFSPQLMGLGEDIDLTITGAYLEGDAVISGGERVLRGNSAFYDFTNDRGIVTDPVFRTVQEQRNIPVYVRAERARILSSREMWFSRSTVSPSEFHTPTYGVSSETAYLMDNTPYSPEGMRLGERAWQSTLKNATFDIRGLPVLWLPVLKGDLQQGNTPLRKATVGKEGDFGWGVETQWHLFRLLGATKPEGFNGRLNLDYYERGAVVGTELDYSRRDYSGYDRFYYVYDADAEDTFGTEAEDIPAPHNRGRVLMRHKQFLPNDWQLQFEFSHICDRNFMQQFFPDEYFAGKEQETVLYAKKQTDNWAFTSLLKYPLNRFQGQAVSQSPTNLPAQVGAFPELGLYLLGQPLADDRLTFYHESHAGVVKWRFDNAAYTLDANVPRATIDGDDLPPIPAGTKIPSYYNDLWSGCLTTFDTREEFSLPLHAGPVNVVPYAVGRWTYMGKGWPDTNDSINFEGDNIPLSRPFEDEAVCVPYGQIGLKTNAHIWAVFNNVDSRLWDLHGLKHVVTPEATAFLSGAGGTFPSSRFSDMNLYPPRLDFARDPVSGGAFSLFQRLQTKRGAGAERHTVDWMRMNLTLSLFDDGVDTVPFDGRFFWDRPEDSLIQNALYGEYFWNISDSTLLLADASYTTDTGQLGKAALGLAVSRDPRLRYYAGVRYIREAGLAPRWTRVRVPGDPDETLFYYPAYVDPQHTCVGTFGVDYQLSRKYSVSLFEQYDFAFDGGINLSSAATITRKLPRSYVALVFSYDASQGGDGMSYMIAWWPEGIEEATIGSLTRSPLARSDMN